MDSFDSMIDGTEGNMNEGAENLFDGDIGSKYCVIATTPFVTFSMKQPVTAKSYALTVANDTEYYNERNPEAWELYGSNDQVSWNVIDKVSKASNIMKPYNYRSYKFTINNPASYKYYKLIFTSSTQGRIMQLSEFSLYAE
ncbi:MAG: F5/8 type C domain protein [Firmicutes bacterium ADurb.Bin419]|nr:MAG: F5/8 type C domain protein [Firmicutes bacterium ADurb.Bin419]